MSRRIGIPASAAVELVREALTDETFNPMDQIFHEALRWNHVPRIRPLPPKPTREASAPATPSAGARLIIPLVKLRAASSMGVREGLADVGEDHDIDYDLLGRRFGPRPKDL